MANNMNIYAMVMVKTTLLLFASCPASSSNLNASACFQFGPGAFHSRIPSLLCSSCPILNETRSIVITMSQCCKIFVLHAWMSHVLYLAAATFKHQTFLPCFSFFRPSLLCLCLRSMSPISRCMSRTISLRISNRPHSGNDLHRGYRFVSGAHRPGGLVAAWRSGP